MIYKQKLCPFCGRDVMIGHNVDCYLVQKEGHVRTAQDIVTACGVRPIEDALRTELAVVNQRIRQANDFVDFVSMYHAFPNFEKLLPGELKAWKETLK